MKPRPVRRAGKGSPPPPAERLQKVLSRAGIASRRTVETWIRAGRVTVNGIPAALGARIQPQDEVRLDGRTVHTAAPASSPVFVCHRSPGEPLRTPADAAAGTTRTGLLERLPRRAGRRFISIAPLPRIDGGLELVTADGALAVRLQRQSHALESEYSVRVRGELDAAQLAGVRSGTLDSGRPLAVAACEAAGGEGSNRWYTLRVRGGSGKSVRQLFERQGALVSRVLRTRLGALALERTLGRGQFRELSAEELATLLGGPPGH
ncbi:MAG: rRNA pseudouridine synthase [Gammaproteobacteria bacterium]|nr:rRNA pseudouridine synthase [Gammaproteobacteria bacterium]